ncbi:uncharacterized protein BX663DRAFT_559023 [Cokeromyces recurvatus]|uniref:uncharacterized protein n=1 Tax=Cokeromyces recurvatus TaxID=90255 RepID=UPI00221F4534|nr:uncharacterized protein BX663DRAFT_559023 [Cokeromyces recurvatus]KAI7905627.1 hypothetical protein BX663DRAFT_559023 [Cokeromyces recurvatus]
MNLLNKIKSEIDLWKLEKYTKRRSFLPEYDSKDLKYYKEVYHDGFYDTSLGYNQGTATKRSRKSKSQLGLLFGKSSYGGGYRLPPCSETYNRM